MADFEFSPNDDGGITLSNAVYQALGAVSMAWSETPRGIFDSKRATEIGEALIDVISTGITLNEDESLLNYKGVNYVRQADL